MDGSSEEMREEIREEILRGIREKGVSEDHLGRMMHNPGFRSFLERCVDDEITLRELKKYTESQLAKVRKASGRLGGRNREK